MSLFNIFRRHPRGDISTHADGELAPERRETLEAHLAGCERCRTELADLLSLRSALRGLPEVAAPRSFALTLAIAEREPTPVASRATPSFVAMRIAGAGFAAALAVVVMLDAGGIVDDTGRSSDESSTALFEDDLANRDADSTGVPTGSDFYAPGEEQDIEGAIAGTPPVADDGSIPNSGGDAGTDGGLDAGVGDRQGLLDGDDDPPLGPLPDNVPEDPDSITTASDDGDNLGDAADDIEKVAEPESGDGAPAAIAAEDDGASSLLAIEIGLAAIAVLAIGGSFVMRRRAVRE